MALGAYEAVLNSGQTDIKCVAVDKNAEALQIMEETGAANLFCLIDNPPDFIGSKGVELAAAYLDGEKVEAEYTTSGDIIAPDEPGWAELFDKVWSSGTVACSGGTSRNIPFVLRRFSQERSTEQ